MTRTRVDAAALRSRAGAFALSATLPFRAVREARFPFRPLEAIERAQRRRLRATVAHAHRHVPYYRETMRRLGVGPDDFSEAADLAKLPVIEREDLQRDPEYFVSELHPPDRCLKLRSGGSSGEPVTVFREPDALFAGAAHRERLRAEVMRLAGRRLRITEASVFIPSGPQGAKASFSSRSLIPSSVRVKRTELSILDSPAEVAAEVQRIRPDVIASYGSYLETLFDHLVETGRTTFPPKVAVFSSDPLGERSRRLITEGFGIEVLGTYRAVEASHIGFECGEHSGYHQNLDLCPIRIFTGDGREAAVGEAGEVITSSLTASGTTLLNYRLGDRCARLADPCPCGRTLPLISYVEGRSSEWLDDERGERLHGQAVLELLRLRDDVLRYQVIQRAPLDLEVLVLARPGADHREASEWIASRFAERLGPGTRTEVRFVSELPRTASGKTLRIVNRGGKAEGGRP